MVIKYFLNTKGDATCTLAVCCAHIILNLNLVWGPTLYFSCTEETVDSQWQNSWDRPLSFSCRDNQALYRVKSTHSNRKEDRVWEWSCRTVLKGNTRFRGSDCKWTGWQNGYDLPLMFQCPANKVLTGVKSIHHNGKEDRVWAFQCCSARDYYTRNCYLSNWINDWDRSMDHRVSSPQVFTGAYSYHNNRHE